MIKKYVDVEVRWKKDGAIVPITVLWDSGDGMERYEIEKILSGPRSMASAAGGVGRRYEVQIQHQRRYLFLEKDKWYVIPVTR